MDLGEGQPFFIKVLRESKVFLFHSGLCVFSHQIDVIFSVTIRRILKLRTSLSY